ncbi:hypothetical protein Tco_0457148, partial [Tanacetum coccineum]
METIHVTFDELLQTMAPVHIGPGPKPMSMTSVQISSGLVLHHDGVCWHLFRPHFLKKRK